MNSQHCYNNRKIPPKYQPEFLNDAMVCFCISFDFNLSQGGQSEACALGCAALGVVKAALRIFMQILSLFSNCCKFREKKSLFGLLVLSDILL